ncbi:MAG TPA: outer membrane beta-barrel protein [Terriglobales bacterium]
MKKSFLVICVLLCCSLAVVAQDYKKAEVFGGYQWTSVDFGSGVDRQNFNGWNAAVSGYFNQNFGITADFSGAYKSEAGASLNVYSYMFGPTLRAPMEKATPFVHALFGGARANASASGFGSLGSDSAFAYAIGGGFDYDMSPNVAVRVVQFDYLGTRFGGENQKNFRYSGGIVFKF